jgi:hypothetical protein
MRRLILLIRILTAAAATCLAASPVAAQQAPAPAIEGQAQHGRLEGEVLGYLALPILLVLTAVIGFAIGGDEEEARASP